MNLLGHMTTFVRVVDAGSLSAAARSLRMSLPAVSRQVAALEESVGGALLVRSTRKQTVTDSGRLYYEHCVRVLREVEAASAIVLDSREAAGVLTVTAPVTLGLERIRPHLPTLLEKYPRLKIDLRIEDRAVDLVGEGVDVAIRGGLALPETTSILARKLMTYRRVIVANPQYLRERGEPSTPHELAGHDILLHASAGNRSPCMWELRRGSEVTSVKLAWTFRSNAVYALREAAIAGLGIAMLPEWFVERDITARRLRVVLGDYDPGNTVVSALYRRELRNSARVRALLDHLHVELKRAA